MVFYKSAIVLSLLNNWATRKIDFVMVSPQATTEFVHYVKFPRGAVLEEGNSQTYLLLLHKNIYGKNQAERIWNSHLHKGLMDIGFTQSKVGECVYTKQDIIFMGYVDDWIIIA